MNEGEDTVVEAAISTGHPGVDEAVAAIAALGDADLATHAATFERAHDALRAALTASPVEADERADVPATDA